jgi:hypothetical protein
LEDATEDVSFFLFKKKIKQTISLLSLTTILLQRFYTIIKVDDGAVHLLSACLYSQHSRRRRRSSAGHPIKQFSVAGVKINNRR